MIPIPRPDATPQAAFPLAVEYIDRFLALDDDSPESDEQKLQDLLIDMFEVGGPEAAALCIAGILEAVLAYAAGDRKAELVGVAGKLRELGHVQTADTVRTFAEELSGNPLVLWQAARTQFTELGLTGR